VEEADWKAQLAADIAQEVRRVRLERGLSVQKLADLCTERGVPMKRSVLANFEGGRRPTLSVAELMTLAIILKVPAVQLLFPVGRRAETVIGPAPDAVDTWGALKWFTGEDNVIPAPPPSSDQGLQDIATISLFRTYDQQVNEWWVNRQRLSIIADTRHESLRRFRSEEDPDAVDDRMLQLTAERLREIEDGLRSLRAQMEAAGLTPPALGSATSFLADPTAPGVTNVERSIPMEPLPPRQPSDPEGDE